MAVLGTRSVDTPTTCPSRMKRTSPAVHSMIAVCQSANVARLQNASWSLPVVAPWWWANAQKLPAKPPSGKSISPSRGQTPLLGHRSQAAL